MSYLKVLLGVPVLFFTFMAKAEMARSESKEFVHQVASPNVAKYRDLYEKTFRSSQGWSVTYLENDETESNSIVLEKSTPDIICQKAVNHKTQQVESYRCFWRMSEWDHKNMYDLMSEPEKELVFGNVSSRRKFEGVVREKRSDSKICRKLSRSGRTSDFQYDCFRPY